MEFICHYKIIIWKHKGLTPFWKASPVIIIIKPKNQNLSIFRPLWCATFFKNFKFHFVTLILWDNTLFKQYLIKIIKPDFFDIDVFIYAAHLLPPVYYFANLTKYTKKPNNRTHQPYVFNQTNIYSAPSYPYLLRRYWMSIASIYFLNSNAEKSFPLQ